MNTKDLSTQAPLSGIFTVNAEGKKVRFAKSNIVRKNGQFTFFDNQYDCLGKNNNKDNSDLFAFNKALEIAKMTGLSLLSELEWKYLFKNNVAKNSEGKFLHIIAGINCLVLKPDGFKGRVKDSYTAEEWKTAEASGLVALPCAGGRRGTVVSYVGNDGYCWSSSPNGGGVNGACCAYFFFDGAYVGYYYRYYGFSVRLVSVQ